MTRRPDTKAVPIARDPRILAPLRVADSFTLRSSLWVKWILLSRQGRTGNENALGVPTWALPCTYFYRSTTGLQQHATLRA